MTTFFFEDTRISSHFKDDGVPVNFVFAEKDPWLLYGYMILGAVKRSFKLGDTLVNDRMFFPMCPYQFYEKDGRLTTIILVALLLTRCISPRLDMLIFNCVKEDICLVQNAESELKYVAY